MTLLFLFALCICILTQPAPAPEAPVSNPPLPPPPPAVPADYCKGSTTGGYDLTPLHKLTTKFKLPGPQEQLIYSVCGSINEACGAAGEVCGQEVSCCGICQQFPGGDSEIKSACLGRLASAKPYGNDVEVSYLSGQPVPAGETTTEPGPRQAYMYVECGSAGVNGEAMPIKFVSPNPPTHNISGQMYTYNLYVHTPILCSGIGFGGWALILMTIGLVCYIVGGIVYAKFVQQKEVSNFMELLPNYEFWVETPGYFMAGISYSRSKVNGCLGREEYSSL